MKMETLAYLIVALFVVALYAIGTAVLAGILSYLGYHLLGLVKPFSVFFVCALLLNIVLGTRIKVTKKS